MPSVLTTEGLINGVFLRWLSLLQVLPTLQRISEALLKSPVTSLTKALYVRLFSFLGRVLVVSNFFHLTIFRAHVLLETFITLEMFFFLPLPCSKSCDGFITEI